MIDNSKNPSLKSLDLDIIELIENKFSSSSSIWNVLFLGKDVYLVRANPTCAFKLNITSDIIDNYQIVYSTEVDRTMIFVSYELDRYGAIIYNERILLHHCMAIVDDALYITALDKYSKITLPKRNVVL